MLREHWARESSPGIHRKSGSFLSNVRMAWLRLARFATERILMKPRTRNTVAANRQNTILVVDDEPSVRETIGRVLAAEGFEVSLAANGVEALEIAASRRVDLVILDLNMPALGGWDTFERLTFDNPFLSVIIVTARPNQLFAALGAGAVALLEKPFDYPKLIEEIRSALKESAKVRLQRLAGRQSDFHYLAPSEKSAA
jgi:DNA-binding response OmpR family regulator